MSVTHGTETHRRARSSAPFRPEATEATGASGPDPARDRRGDRGGARGPAAGPG